MDLFEHQVGDLDSACRVMDRHMPEHFDRLRSWQRQTAQLFGREFSDLIEKAADAITLCLARIVLRNGSAAEVHRYFHDEQHPFDLMERVRRLYTCAPTTLAHLDYIALAIFAAGHDLRQDLRGLDPDGVGRNERASAEELERILDCVGIDARAHGPMRTVLRQMIYGTTFHTRTFSYQGHKYHGGVLAPALVEYLQSQPAAASEALSPHQINLVLLATDVDTGNVADPFVLFVDRGVRLCREIFALTGRTKLDTDTAVEVYSFLTGEQERYLFVLQQFHASATRDCFQADKEANGVKLRALTAAMRARYESVLARPGHDVTGEQVISSYIDLAETV